MRKTYLLLILFFAGLSSYSQVKTDPSFPKADAPITFTVDVSGTGLQGYTDKVWIWTWIENGTNDINAPTNVNPATDAQSNALMTRSSSDPNVYTITFTPTEFFSKPADEINKIGLLLKGRDWSNGQTPDYFVEMTTGEFDVSITSPTVQPLFLQAGESLTISATASETANLTLLVNNNVIASVTAATEISHVYQPASTGEFNIKVSADNGSLVAEDSVYFIVSEPAVTEPRPSGVIAGINYFDNDPSRVILDILAPGKSSVYVIGDFTNWNVDPQYQMKKDGEHFWIEITGLEAGVEYGFQYLVDETIFIADPFADKILDPEDQYIPETQYPGLKAYPSEALHEQWYFNRVSIIETGQTPYQWKNEPLSFGVDSLIIYELLIRDFFENGNRSYQSLTDTLSYFKELGINAIQLMPVMEFNGNESWGYNPTFMFAPDKYYGPKEELKAFVDAAHGLDIAVILDITLNHQDMPNSFLMMNFDYQNFKPTADNPYFNMEATHPFNVFFDMNHESAYTQAYLDTINHYWLNEYKVDGFRYDLSKGFTQKVSGGDVGLWSSYDASRIALLKRMSDEIRTYDDDALLILEHFADNTEEIELSDYGFLLWGNLNHSYAQAAMGYASDADINWAYYKNRGWNNPHLITYMESHDEERTGYKVKQFGASSATYSTRELNERNERLKAAALFLYTLPGPKMMWQWGEWGYDVSIEFDGRLGIKPTPVELGYLNESEQKEIFNFYQALLNLRKEKVFNYGDAEITTLANNVLLKQMTIKSNPYSSNPTSADQMNVVIVGNFDVTEKQVNISFPHIGEWYNYFSSVGDLSVNNATASVKLKPGEFRLYTDVQLEEPADLITSVHEKFFKLLYYPNPVKDNLFIETKEQSTVHLYDMTGKNISTFLVGPDTRSITLTSIPNGIYMVDVQNPHGRTTFKIIKQ